MIVSSTISHAEGPGLESRISHGFQIARPITGGDADRILSSPYNKIVSKIARCSG